MTRRVAFAMVASIAVLTNPAAGQDPTGGRSSLVINEIMLNPEADQCPWVEVRNPTDHAVVLQDFAAELGSGTLVRLPASAASVLDPGRLQLIVIETPGCDIGFHRTAISVPAPATAGWPTEGTLSLRRRGNDVDPMSEWELVDFVAWGRPPAVAPMGHLDLWPATAFVPLRESLGFRYQGVEIPAGWSIGLYPQRPSFGPGEWVLFDSHESTPGWENRVPTPKAFTLTDGATVGSRSVGFTWSRKNGDESYRFRLYQLPDTLHPIIDTTCDLAAVRIGAALPTATYLYTVVARSPGMESYASTPRTFRAIETACDWPLTPDASSEFFIGGLASWLLGPSCGDNPECALLPSMRFKFQRKDSPLRCVCCNDTNCLGEDLEPRCPYNGVQPYCFNVLFGDGRSPTHLCAGGTVSPTCRRRSSHLGSSNLVAISSGILGQATNTWWNAAIAPTVESCEHGQNYCAFASLSMVASAYGTCLSQDWIANQRCLLSQDAVCSNLSHDLGVHNDTATKLLAWTLGIPESGITVDPPQWRWAIDHPPPISEPTAAFFAQQYPPALTFDMVKYWVGSNRAVMGRQGGHFHAVAGYCEEPVFETEGIPTRRWIYVFDPRDGPKVQLFHEWLKLTATAPADSSAVQIPKGVWVGPPGFWAATKKDDPAVWADSNDNGISDYDDARP